MSKSADLVEKLTDVTASATEINHNVGVTSPIQTQINGKLGNTETAVDAVKWDGANKTVSTSTPSGGVDGDIWIQYEV